MKTAIKKYKNERGKKMKKKIIVAALLCSTTLFTGFAMPVSAPEYECKITDVPNPFVKIDEVEEVKELITVDVARPTNELLRNKTYMDYRKITNRDTAQWKYIWSDAITVDDKGFLVTEDGFIGVALGTYFGPVGTKYIFTLDSGIELKVVKVEVKSDKHTCENNYKAGSNDVIEFVIDTQAQYMQDNIWGNGLIFQGNFNNCEDFKGNIIKIQEVIE